MPNVEVEFEVTLMGSEHFIIRTGSSNIILPMSVAGDLATALEQVWLEYHMRDQNREENSGNE
jgi:virulence-associated protein VagC